MKNNISFKNNVNIFGKDVANSGSYVYTTKRLSAKLANQRISQATEDLLSCRGKRILDMGCGDGTYTLELARKGACQVLGVDPVQSAVESASKKAKEAGLEQQVQFKYGDIYNLDLDEYFDCTILRGVLHHLPDPVLAIKKLAHQSDRILITEPNGANPIVKILEKTSRYHIEHEEQSFLLKTVGFWLNTAGMRIERRRYINLVPMFCPDWLARICKTVEPLIESLPVLRSVLCGQYIILANKIQKPCSV